MDCKAVEYEETFRGYRYRYIYTYIYLIDGFMGIYIC